MVWPIPWLLFSHPRTWVPVAAESISRERERLITHVQSGLGAMKNFHYWCLEFIFGNDIIDDSMSLFIRLIRFLIILLLILFGITIYVVRFIGCYGSGFGHRIQNILGACNMARC